MRDFCGPTQDVEKMQALDERARGGSSWKSQRLHADLSIRISLAPLPALCSLLFRLCLSLRWFVIVIAADATILMDSLALHVAPFFWPLFFSGLRLHQSARLLMASLQAAHLCLINDHSLIGKRTSKKSA